MLRLLRSSPLLFIAILASVGCSDAPKKASADDAAAIQHQGNRVTVPPSSPLADRLDVEPVQFTGISRQVTAPASVEADPARYARIFPPLNGRVLKLFVHPGDSVEKGDELLLLDSPDFGGVQADYARARTVLTQTEHSLERQQDLAAHGIVGQREVEQAKTDRDSALSDFNRTKDRLRLLGMDPDKTTLGSPLIVRSPLTGKVLDIPAVATFAAYPTERFGGKVLFVADVLDPDTRTAKVRIAYPNRDGRLRPAMFATVTLKTWDTKELTVATTALVLSGDKTTVFVQISPNTFEQRRVGTGEQIGQRTVVKDRLQIGDKVLIREGALLQ